MPRTIEEVRQLLNLFKTERYFYIAICIMAFLALIFCAFYILFQGQENYPAIIGLFGSTGGVGYTSSRLLKMWNDALNFMNDTQSDEQ